MTEQTTFNTPESFEVARNYAALLGSVPSSFTTSIRSLVADIASGTISPVTRSRSWLMIRGPTIQGFCYFALQTALGKSRAPNAGQLESHLFKLKPLDLASLIATVLFVRRVQRALEKIPEDLKMLLEGWQRNADFGLIIGEAIPPIGLGVGLMASSLPSLGMASFFLHDPKGAREYRRHLKQKDLWIHFPYEMQRWGCTSAQVGAAVMQGAAFGMSIPTSLMHGLQATTSTGGEVSPSIIAAARYAKLWIETLRITGKGVTSIDNEQYLPVRDSLGALEEQISILRTVASVNNCLTRSKEDFFRENGMEVPPSTPAD